MVIFHSYVSLPEGNCSTRSNQAAWALNTGQMWTSRDKYTAYPLVSSGKPTKNYGKSHFFMGISTINGDFQ